MYMQGILTDSISTGDWLAPVGRSTKTGNGLETKLPASWGSDVVTLSDEVMLAGATSGGERRSGLASGTREAFAKYMEKARSQTQDDEEGSDLEKLQKKLKKLRERLAQAMTRKNADSTNDGLEKALNSQIREVMTRIAKLTAQAMQVK